MEEADSLAVPEPSVLSNLDDDRRRYLRMDIRYEMTAQVGDETLALSTRNLSFGGAYIECRGGVSIGDSIKLKFNHGEEQVESLAHIVHQDKRGFAAAFVKPSQHFTSVLCGIVCKQIINDAKVGDEYEVPGRVAVLAHQGEGFEVLFTSNLGASGIWVLSEKIRAYNDTLWISVLEQGMFDCETRVIWCTGRAMALEFINPSEDFTAAYQRILSAFSM